MSSPNNTSEKQPENSNKGRKSVVFSFEEPKGEPKGNNPKHSKNEDTPQSIYNPANASKSDEKTPTTDLNEPKQTDPVVESNPIPEADPIDPSEITDYSYENKNLTIAALIFINFLIPICLALICLGTMSVLGIVYTLLLACHIFIANKVKGKFTALRIEIVFTMVISIAIFVFSILNNAGILTENKTNGSDILQILGLNFNNSLISGPMMSMMASLFEFVFSIISIAFLGKISPGEFMHIRNKFFGSLSYQYIIDLLWNVTLTYIGASASSYVFLPLLVYFTYTSIMCSLTGRNCVHYVLRYIVGLYSILHTLFMQYAMSYIGEKWGCAKTYPNNFIIEKLKFNRISPDGANGFLMFVNILSTYVSIEVMTAPGSNGTSISMREIPNILTDMSTFFTIIAFVATFFFAISFNSYISLSWLLISIIASFFSFGVIKVVFFKVLAVVFNLSFVAIMITCFNLLDRLKPKNSNLIEKIGFFKYQNNFTFVCIGFYIATLIGQIGRISNFKINRTRQKKIDSLTEEEFFDLQMKEIRKAKFISAMMRFLYTVANGASIVIGITYGFYKNRYAYQCVFIVYMIVALFSLYFYPVFQFLKFIFGILIIASSFFYVYRPNYSWITSTGLSPPSNDTLISYIWSLIVDFFLTIFLTSKRDIFPIKFPPILADSLFVIVVILHYVYIFAFDTTIFNLLFSIVAVGMISFLFLDKRNLLVTATIFSTIFVSVQLASCQLTLFDSTRNFLAAAIKNEIFPFKEIFKPNFEIALLSLILFFSTIAFNSEPVSEKSTDSLKSQVGNEILRLLRTFFFYLSWIFTFEFSVANKFPTFIKFLLSVLFLLGPLSTKMFAKIRYPVLFFQLILLAIELIFQIWEIGKSDRDIKIINYIGFVFSPGKVTKRQRNVSYVWQLCSILITVVNLRPDPAPASSEFNNLIFMRIYNAFCAFLHHLLPVIVEIILCYSTLSNPSVIGLLSFIVLVLVAFKPVALENHAQLVTLIFNILMIIQYLFWLGLPVFIKFWSVGKLMNDWGKFLGVVNVNTEALISNCLACIILTLYLQFHSSSFFIDYDRRYNELPKPCREIIDFIVRYVYELVMTIVLILSSQISSYDGVLFFLLAACLFVASMTAGYAEAHVMNLLSWGTFIVIGMHWISRIPFFTVKGSGSIARKAFDLPFKSSSENEDLWVFIYSFLRFCVHIDNSKIRAEVTLRQEQHLAYKYIRDRQLEIIEDLDRQILNAQYQIRVRELRTLSATQSMKNNNQKALMGTSQSQFGMSLADFSFDNSLSGQKTSWIVTYFIYPLVDKLINLLASSLPLNAEAGVNVLTLETIAILLRKRLKAYEQGRTAQVDYKEKNYIRSLPPSFKLQLHSVGSIVDFDLDFTKSGNRWELFIRYILMFIRRGAFPLLVLLVIIYAITRPYLFASIYLLYVVGFMSALRIRRHPFVFRVILILSMINLFFRKIAHVVYLDQVLKNAVESVAEQQRSIPLLKLFGLNPIGSSAIEILIFMIVIFYITDQQSMLNVSPRRELTKRFTESKVLKDAELPFPEHFCYEIIGNPSKQLNFENDPEYQEKFFEDCKTSLHKPGLLLTGHRLTMIAIDIFSLILLFICFPKWVSTNSNTGDILKDSTSRALTTFFVFILIIHVACSLIAYFADVSQKYAILFFENIVTLLYEIILLFFYIPSKHGSSPGSLQFYLIVRLFWHLVASHKVYHCKVFSDFIMPDLANNGSYVFWTTKFMRYCPFVFEIRVIVSWLSHRTQVPLSDFFILQDFKLELEGALSTKAIQQKEAETGKEPRKEPNCLIGWLLLILLVILVFVPLLFLTESGVGTKEDPMNFASLELGLTNGPSLIKCIGDINELTDEQQKELLNSKDSRIRPLAYAKRSSLRLITFPQKQIEISSISNSGINQLLRQAISENPMKLFAKISLTYKYPASISRTTEIVYFNSTDITNEQREQLSILLDSTEALSVTLHSGDFKIPQVFAVERQSVIHDIGEDRVPFTISRRKTGSQILWSVGFQNSMAHISLLKGSSNFKILVYSEPTYKELKKESMPSSCIIGIYLLIVLTLGEVIREFAMSTMAEVWIDRLKKPEKVYRMITSIEAFRSAGEKAKENDMCRMVLNLIKSHEKTKQMAAPRNKGLRKM